MVVKKHSPWCVAVVAVCLLLPGLSLAQDQDKNKTWGEEGELESVEIEIVRERQITLPTVNRNFDKIPPKPSEPIKPPITYDFRAFNFQTPQINPLIRPLKLKDAAKSEVYGGYVTAGYGNYASPYLEGFINSKRDKNKLVGAHAYLYSSDKGPVDKTNSGSGMAGVSFFGQTFSKDIALSGNVGFENRSTHFYGYAPGTVVEAKDIKQFYNLFKLGGELANARNTDFSYKLGAGFSYLADKLDARETEVDIDFGSAYKVSDESAIRLKAGYYLISRKDIAVTNKGRSLFTVTPAYEFFLIENLKFSAGLIAAFENDSIDRKSTHIYPDFHASYPLSPSVEVTGALTGGMEKVSLQSLLAENIWLAPNVPVFHTNKLLDIQGALHSKVGNKVTADVGFSIARLKNWYYFINTAADQSRFTTIYDNGQTQRNNLFVALGYTQANVAKVLFRADAYRYATDELKDETRAYGDAFHRPTYKLSLDASYNIYQKIILTAKVLAQGGMKAWNQDQQRVVKLDAAFDLNFKAEYLFSDSFSFFAQFNNITSSKYPVFQYYPVRGLQVTAGITWSF